MKEHERLAVKEVFTIKEYKIDNTNDLGLLEETFSYESKKIYLSHKDALDRVEVLKHKDYVFTIEKIKKVAYIRLKENTPAGICLDNKDYYDSQEHLRGFEWNVYTNIGEDCWHFDRNRRLCGFRSYKEAEKMITEMGYAVHSQDFSTELLRSINDYEPNTESYNQHLNK
tara:strand:- start:53 stop:562 length:510 start_codon:yes stop_codon:yes gene_type:complete